MRFLAHIVRPVGPMEPLLDATILQHLAVWMLGGLASGYAYGTFSKPRR